VKCRVSLNKKGGTLDCPQPDDYGRKGKQSPTRGDLGNWDEKQLAVLGLVNQSIVPSYVSGLRGESKVATKKEGSVLTM